MKDFALSDEMWTSVEASFLAIGRTVAHGHRGSIEFPCWWYVKARSGRDKKHTAKPADQRDQWEVAAKHADKLATQMERIKADPEAASFSFLDWLAQRHGLDSEALLDQLSLFSQYARTLAAIEAQRPKRANAFDHDRQAMADSLIGQWIGLGGKPSFSRPPGGGAPTGPLIRFLGATYAEACVAASEAKPSSDELAHQIRVFRKRQS